MDEISTCVKKTSFIFFSINEIDQQNLRLSCQTDDWWYHCQFSHKSNGKSCQIDWTSGTKVKVNQCSEGIKYKGRVRDYNNFECIVEIEEVAHAIHLQFQIKMQWGENRVTYQNLKDKTSLNALSNSDISMLWLPLVIYDNTDQKVL